MTAVHLVERSNRSLYDSALEEHFRIRHRIYVGERRWMALERPDGREVDQFDTPEAVYLLALDKGRVVGGSRFVPTTQPHLMSDVFPELANVRGLVRRPDVYEWTRVFVVPERRGEGRPKVESLVLCALQEFGLLYGLSHITVVMETWWLPRLLALGWDVQPLGLPREIDGMQTMGAIIEVCEEALASTRRARAVEGPVLVWRGRNGQGEVVTHV